MRRTLQVLLAVIVVVSGIVLYNLLRDAQWAHSWLKSLCAMLPEVGTIIAVVELHHTAEANTLRSERNGLAEANNELEESRNQLMEEKNILAEQKLELQRQLDSQRNEHLAEIARQVERPQSVAEKNAARLRKYIGRPVAVTNRDGSGWGTAPLIAEVSDENILALFLPSQQGSQATAIYADCTDVEITEIAQGACPIQIKVNKRYGTLQQLGNIAKWEDRNTAAAASVFERGNAAFNAQYSKPGVEEIRTAFIFSSKDRSNSFLLETSTGERFVGNNKAVSIRFLAQQVEYFSDGFQRNGMGTGESAFPLYVC